MVMTVPKIKLWCVVIVVVSVVLEVACLNGPNVCMVQQKYNITKRVKYRAPMSVRTYEWCFSMPPRCSKWKTEMRELTKLETDERIAEVAVCCPGYKMKDVSCVPICPNGKTGHRCSDECPSNKWGPNCVNDCDPCHSGTCSPITGDCSCQDGWQGESCEIRMLPTTSTTTTAEDLLTKSATKPTPIAPTISSSPASVVLTSTLLATIPPSRTTLVEMTSHPHKLMPILDTTSVSNKTAPLEILMVSNKSLIDTLSLIPTQTTLIETSSTRTSTTKQPSAVIKTTTSPVTASPETTSTLNFTSISTITTVAPRLTDTTTTIATTVPAITTEVSTLIPITKGKQTKEIEASSNIKTTTVHTIQTTEEIDKKMLPTTTELAKLTKMPNYWSMTTNKLFKTDISIEQTTKKVLLDSKYNRTEVPIVPQVNVKELHIPVHIAEETKVIVAPYDTKNPKTTFDNVTGVPVTTHRATVVAKIETTKRQESTIRYFPTTVKFKPKEIWIRPAQKGESYKSKSESNQDLHSKPRVTQPNTTPKTIVVSIIPTSVSYATFKKIALTTASLLFQKTNMTVATPNGTAEQEVTKPMITLTTTEPPITAILNKVRQKILTTSKLNQTKQHSFKSEPYFERTTKTFSTFHTTKESLKNKTVSTNGINSMPTDKTNLNSNFLTTSSTNATRSTQQQNKTLETTTVKSTVVVFEKVTRPIKIVTVKPRNVTIITVSGNNKNETIVKITKAIAKDTEKTNATRTIDFIKTNQVTTESSDGEEFHILTEPEHITAVMEGKGTESASLDLLSVISIAGGIMMAVITVAVIIVMVERCKKPRYSNVRKMSDIRLQVMIDNDVPPPYVRSIFHTPLPDPPGSEKCHYQPISTLDRNLKQFMRPVVVQSISPIMLENFRGILECHCDHLPRRSHQFDQSQRHCSLSPSVGEVDELTCLRPCSAMDSTIEALKCEARLDIIDSTTSEPLYAEIPCWRPPSEHAIEILNLNGEAVTEL